MPRRRRISQSEAMRLRAQVRALTSAVQMRANPYAQDFPGGVHVGSIVLTDAQYAAVQTARRLGHAVIATAPNARQLELYAQPIVEAAHG